MSDKKQTLFKINLYAHWVKAGKPSAYRINLDTHVSRAAIANYIAEDGVILESISSAIIAVAEYLGVYWKDVVTEYVENEDEEIVPSPVGLNTEVQPMY